MALPTRVNRGGALLDPTELLGRDFENVFNRWLGVRDGNGGTATGTLAVTNGPDGALIAGDLALDEAHYQFGRQAATQVRELAGVRRRGEPIRPPNEELAEAGVPGIWRLDLRLRADNRLFVSGMGLVNIFTFLTGEEIEAAEVARRADAGDANARHAAEPRVHVAVRTGRRRP